MFVGKKNSVRAAKYFTLAALHERGRVWDIFYIQYPPGTDKTPVFLVPTYQFQHLLDVINAELGTQLAIPPGKNELRFNMKFGMGNTPRPRFLGRSSNPDNFIALTQSTLRPHPDDKWEDATENGKLEYLDLLSLVTAGTNKQASSEKNREKRIINHRAWGRSVKRAQRYLGLRQQNSKLEATTDTSTPLSKFLDLTRPPPFDPEDSVLFVSIDVEAYEFNQDFVTEVGISTLDAKNIAKVAPGGGRDIPLGSEGWYPHINARHIRVKEALWVTNQKHVHGCPEHFDFGDSEIVPADKAMTVVENIIRQTVDGGEKRRPIVLVFHDAAADTKFLQSQGYDILSEENIIDVIDTKEMHQFINRSIHPRSLEHVLSSLGIHFQHLHNAGNDAVYTMRAFVSLAIKARQMSMVRYEENMRAREAGIDDGHVPYAEFKKKKEQDEGWSSGGEGSDGDDAPRKKTESKPSW